MATTTKDTSPETAEWFDSLDKARADAEADAEAQFADREGEKEEEQAKSIEDLAADEIHGIAQDENDGQIVIDGNTGQLSLSVGGSKPKTSEFRMRSAAVQVEGQYAKGDTVTLSVVVRIDEIDFVDMHDEFGNVRTTKRVHKGKPISIEKVVVTGDTE